MWVKLDYFRVVTEYELVCKGNDSQTQCENIHYRKDSDKYLKQLYQDIFSHGNVKKNNRGDMKKVVKEQFGEKSYRCNKEMYHI